MKHEHYSTVIEGNASVVLLRDIWPDPETLNVKPSFPHSLTLPAKFFYFSFPHPSVQQSLYDPSGLVFYSYTHGSSGS